MQKALLYFLFYAVGVLVASAYFWATRDDPVPTTACEVKGPLASPDDDKLMWLLICPIGESY